MNQKNNWTFEGEVGELIEKRTKKDKPFIELVLHHQDGEHERLAVCTYWHKPPDGLAQGSLVRVSGRLDGREWNGKYYAGLTAEKVEVLTDEATDRPADQPDVEAANAANDAAAEDQAGEVPF